MSTITKILLTLGLFLMSISTINAQSNNETVMQFGVKGGVNLSKLKNIDEKAKMGLVAGFFAEYGLSDRFSLRSEVLFSVQGVKKIKLNYVNFLPLLAKFYPTERFSIEVGPQLGVLISKSGSSLLTKSYKRLDYGVAVGTGFHITENVEIGVRYNLGLRDITKTTGVVKNSVFQATLSYGF